MTGWGNWTYFFPGRFPVLVDAGVGNESHLNAIALAAPDGPRHVLVTHAHSDHIGGASAIRSRWPETEFSKMAWPERDAKFPLPWTPLLDGDVVPAGDGELHVIHTPGHAPDHIVLWEPVTRTLLSADLVVPGTTVVIPASMEGNLAAYLASLERVLALAPARLLPSHGSPIDEPAEILQRYLTHRREREQQVIAALRAGDRSVDALVGRIYAGLKPALIAMARESVLAHLRKLHDEGVAQPSGDEWILN